MKIKVNKAIASFKIGQVVDIKTDNNNTPLSMYWRRRLKDAATDSCIEIVKDKVERRRPKTFLKEKRSQDIKNQLNTLKP